MDTGQLYNRCTLCPRMCGVDRTAGARGYCDMGAEPLLARISLHEWEEPCISGTRGSGTVFFAGCSLGCVYCQNSAILSGKMNPAGGRDLAKCKTVSANELAGAYLRLEEKGAHNINLVTAGHFLPHVAESIRIARSRGLAAPIVYNTSGYERAESLRMLRGLVDIYLADFRYMDPETAAAYSKAPDYPEAAKAAFAEMMDQTAPVFRSGSLPASPPDSEFLNAGADFDDRGMMRSGVIARVLLLPGHVREAREIVSYLHETYGDRIWLSLLSQYTPLPQVASDPLLGRKVTRREYERLLQHTLSLGVKNAFIQKGGAAEESFIPVWGFPKSSPAMNLFDQKGTKSD